MDGLIAGGLRAEEAAAPYRVAPLLTGHLDTFASAPEGFKRLRELVLNLAVRGRLVPQDAKDEPAEKLLERIRSTSYRATQVTEDFEPHELPSSWAWTTLGEITNIGENIKAGILQSDVWVLDLEDIEKDTSKVTRKVRFSERQPKSDKNVFSAGDVLYGKLRPYLNKVIVADEPGVCTTEILPLRGYGDIDANYIKTFLKSPGFIGYVSAKSYGMKMPRLGTTDAKRAHFALPPLAEQSRIVAKVKELMALIDALEAKVGAGETARGKLLDALLAALADSPDAATADAWTQLAPQFDLLLQTPADVDRLQQTLLQLAVKGRLVPQDPKDEPAAEILKRIRAKKERLFAEGKTKRDKSLPPIAEDEIQYSLPQGWAWVRIPTIADTRLGKMLDKAKNRGQLKPYLRNTNVQWFRFDLSDIKELRLEDDELAEFRVLPGDLLICEGGEPGRCAIWRDGEREIYFQKALHRVRTYCGVMPEFIQLCLSVDCASGWLKRFFTGATIKHFPGQELETYCVPLPPLSEQSRIVAAVGSLTALCDRLRERLAARRALSAKLATALTESALQ